MQSLCKVNKINSLLVCTIIIGIISKSRSLYRRLNNSGLWPSSNIRKYLRDAYCQSPKKWIHDRPEYTFNENI